MTRPQSGGDVSDLNSFSWVAPNPFGELTPFLLLTPGNEKGRARLNAFAAGLELQPIDSGQEMAWIGTDYLTVALRGLAAELGTEDNPWLNVPVPDQWTSAALSRKYVVLAVGDRITADDMDTEQISAYIRQEQSVRAALVKIRLRVTDS